MIITDKVDQIRLQINEWKAQGETIGFVPTMGNLHAGHLSLVEEAKKHATKIVVSIFVNPMQFDQSADLAAYPRTLQQDCQQLIAEGVDLLFTPTPDIMYPKGLAQQTFVEVPHISERFCGASRPGHFRGVATVVTKLFNIVAPHTACFGEKDYQQLRVIKLMVDDLSMGINIVGVPTMREQSGLAMSSRNGYLTEQELQQAPALYQTLLALKQQMLAGNSDITALIHEANDRIAQAGFTPDYFHIQDGDDMSDITEHTKHIVIIAAAHLGKARLIDNIHFYR
ncbi:pantoate--beta-alanine ligase [Flocculibacter collagenilyticus]|uniref:pantoate--beta-alanine ligase n=1 Tax=Flocculibacter collagenilyticus TaxID=2744479 RepID=UPI0018F65987|nr:pantoate--beta-alanine ligase [Flocculibacter collagenilyticus]